jgi:hypothetical protein
VLWGDHTGPNAIPFVFLYTKVVSFFILAECPSECVFPNVSPNVFRLFSECFQYSFRMLSEQTEYFPHVDFERISFRTRSVCFPNAFRTRRIVLEWTELFPHAFRTFSEIIRHVLGPFGVFGKHTESSTSKLSFRMHHELDACFPNVFRTCRMLLECSRILPENTWTPHSESRRKLF